MLSILAHLTHGNHGFADGVLHPITGADHLVAAVAVGVLARLCLAGEPARRAGTDDRRAGAPAEPWTLPLAFVGGMTIGGALARLGVALPGVEVGIALSLVAVGVALCVRKVGPTPIAAGSLALFAAFHGHAHLVEANADVAGFAVGLIVATALLHAAGIGVAMTVERFKLPAISFARAAGVATIAFGALKLAGVA